MLKGVRDRSRRFVGSEAIRRELLDDTSRWATTGIVVDWADWDRLYRDAGELPTKDEQALGWEQWLRDDDRRTGRLRDELLLLAGAPAPRRSRAGAARAGRARHGPAHGDDAAPQHAHGGRDHCSAALLQPSSKDGQAMSQPRRPDASWPHRESYDAIVVGGGHNGLTNAAYLAQAGLRTLVLEQRPFVGGAAITEELRPGFSFTTFSYALSLLRPEIIHELNLVEHGFLPLMMPGDFHPTGDGDYLLFGDDDEQNVQMIRGHSRHNADAYTRYNYDLDRVIQTVRPLFDNPPPNIFGTDPDDQADIAWLLKHLGSVDRKTIHDTVRMLTCSAADLLDDYFEYEPLKGYLASSSNIGNQIGPMSGGSGLVLLYHKMGEHDGHLGSWSFHKGGDGGSPRCSLARPSRSASRSS